MRRKLFTFLAGISLLLLIAVTGLGVRGYLRADHFDYMRTVHSSRAGGCSDSLGLVSSNGRLLLWVRRARFNDQAWNRFPALFVGGLHYYADEAWDLHVCDNRLGEAAGRFRFGLMAYLKDPNRARAPFSDESGFAILLPSWFLALLFSLLPALRLRRWLLDRQRNRPGFCRQCGYDLRATPGRCPECGMVVGQ